MRGGGLGRQMRLVFDLTFCVTFGAVRAAMDVCLSRIVEPSRSAKQNIRAAGGDAICGNRPAIW